MAFLTGLSARLWAYLAAAGALLLVLWRIVAGIQKAERDRIAARAAEAEQQATERGNAAAADAERDGAVKRLRDGNF